MAFTGKLEEIQIPDLLQIISSGQKSGRLRLNRHDSTAVVVFRRGRIIYAASTSGRETLGNLLLNRHLVSAEQLLQALEAQRESPREKRLGSILVESGAISREALEGLIGEQVERVIRELLDWKKGFFQFDLVEIADRGEVEVDARGFLLTRGLSPDKVLIKIASQLEEAESGPPPPAPPAAEPNGASDSPGSRTAAASPSLRAIMSEVRSPEFTGELSIKIMSFAANLVSRGVLFYVRRGQFCGMGQFGVELSDRSADEAVREMRIPLTAESVLADAADRRETYHGPLADTEWNRYLVRELGGLRPREAIALPLVVNSVSLLVFYGDSAPDHRPIESLSEFEVLMLQAALAMEKQLLEKRIEQFRRLRQVE